MSRIISAEAKALPAALATQISLSEWFEAINHTQREVFRQEDNDKTKRLAALNEIIGLPIDKPTTFAAADVAGKSAAFAAYLAEHGDELCALRLVPQLPHLPKLRMRGMIVREVVATWLPQQAINPTNYLANFFSHAEQTDWSTIYIINQHGIFGEIIAGGLGQLSQGLYADNEPKPFSFDFKQWRIDSQDKNIAAHLKKIVEHVRVPNAALREQLAAALRANFTGEYLHGYFETVSNEFGLHFVDYNRMLGEFYADFRPAAKVAAELSGYGASPGRVQGKVRVVTNPAAASLQFGDILVCDMTTPDFVPLMQRAGAIVTDRGGVLCHAAIVSRELGKPCIVGTKVATKVLQDGDEVEVDGDKGIVQIIKKSH